MPVTLPIYDLLARLKSNISHAPAERELIDKIALEVDALVEKARSYDLIRQYINGIIIELEYPNGPQVKP